jgi:oxygen-independent coproporphyrinogen-3 oxidase
MLKSRWKRIPEPSRNGTYQELCNAGINRISLGVQALDDAVLEEIGRVHRVQDIHDAIDMIRRVLPDRQYHRDTNNHKHGDDHDDDHYRDDDNDTQQQPQQSQSQPNFSIDLISGLPGVSLAKWAETLETTVRVLETQPCFHL